MKYSIRFDERFADAIESADEHFREGFAALLNAALKGQPNVADVNERVKAKIKEKPLTGARGNRGAIRDFKAAAGWIQMPYTKALFEVLAIPNAAEFASAYDSLHKAIDGRTESWYRGRNRRKRYA